MTVDKKNAAKADKAKKSFIRRLARPVIYLGLLVASLWILVATHFGLVLSVLLVERIMLDSITIDDAKGRLIGPLAWQKIQIGRGDDATVIRDGKIDWLFSADRGGLLVHIIDADIKSITIASSGEESDASDTESKAPGDIEIPVTVLIDRLYIGTTALSSPQTKQAPKVVTELWQELELAAAWHNNRLDIAALTIKRSDADVKLNGKIETLAEWPLKLTLHTNVVLPEQKLKQAVNLKITGTVQDLKAALSLNGAANGSLNASVQAFAVGGIQAQADYDIRTKALDQWQEGLGKAQPHLRGNMNFAKQADALEINGNSKLSLGNNTFTIVSHNQKLTIEGDLQQATEIHPALLGAGKLIGSVQLPVGGLKNSPLQYTAAVNWRDYPTPSINPNATSAFDANEKAAFTINASGTDKEHDFSTQVNHPRSKIALSGNAKLSNPIAGSQLIDIQLKTADIKAERQNLALKNPSQILITTGEVFSAKVAPLCLLAKNKSGVCLQADHKGTNTSAQGDFKALSLAFLEPFTGRKEALDASINGNWQVAIKQGSSDSFVKISKLELRHTELGVVSTSGRAQLAAPWKIDLDIVGAGKSIDQKFHARAKGSLENAQVSLDGSGLVSGDLDVKGNLLKQDVVIVADIKSRSLATFSTALGQSPATLKLNAKVLGNGLATKINGSGELIVNENNLDFTISPDGILAQGELPRIIEIVPALSGGISINADIPLLDKNKPLVGSIQWKGFVMPDGEQANFDIDAKGTLDQHSFTLDAQRPGATLAFGANGRWQAAQSSWQGSITETVLALDAGISFSLEDEAKVSVKQGDVELHNFCLRGNPGGLFCADASKRGETLITEGKLEEVPIELFSPWLNLPPWLTLTIDGDWRFQPEKGVRAELRTGKIVVSSLGLTIEKNTLLVEGDNLDRLTLTAVSTLDKQDLKINALILQTEKGLNVEGTAKAATTKVLNRDDIAIAIAPDLQFAFAQGDKLSIKGNVVVAEGKVNLDKLTPSDEPSLSDDIVIVSEQKEKEEETGLDMDIDVLVNIIKPITITGFGFSGSVEGDLRVHQKPKDVLLATGELDAAGRYKAWGQDLTIDRGKIYYQRSPIAEPLLDINANRQVGKYKVGVNASGLASQPKLTVFSQPATNETDALTMLVTGRELGAKATKPGEQELVNQAIAALSVKGGNWFAERYGNRVPVDTVQVEIDEASGKPGVVAGRQISPKLYMGFKVLLESATQVWEMRYQISERCELSATSGVASEGGVGCRYETR